MSFKIIWYLPLILHSVVSIEVSEETIIEIKKIGSDLKKEIDNIKHEMIQFQRQIAALNDTEELEERVFILELEMDNVQDDVVILYDDVDELRNQDSLTDIRLTTIEEIISTPWIACESSPCDNGATCIDVNVDTFICLCRDGFFGPTCSNSYADTVFLATIGAQTVTPVPNPIVFNETRLNPGGHYDNTTGKYTVSIDGIYEFNVNVFGHPDNDFGGFLVGDGIDIVHCRNSDGSGPGLMSAGFSIPIHARAGQEFWVRPYILETIFGRVESDGELLSWFAGYLISAD